MVKGQFVPGIIHQNHALGSFAVSEMVVVGYLRCHLHQATSLLPGNKLQSLWQGLFSCDQQQLCISTGRSCVIFLMKLSPLSVLIQITFCRISLLFLPPLLSKRLICSFSLSLPSHCCIQGEGNVFAVFHHYLLLVLFPVAVTAFL